MRRVLIADSNLPFATMVADELQRRGDYRAVVATSGPETLQLGVAFQPHVAVMDGALPELQTELLIGQLRRIMPDLQVVFIPTASGNPPAHVRLQAILPKPFLIQDLMALLDKLFGSDVASEAVMTELARREIRPTAPLTPAPKLRRLAGTGMLTAAAPAPLAMRDDVRRNVEKQIEMMSRALRDEPVFVTQQSKVLVIVPRLSGSAAQALANVAGRAWPGQGAAAAIAPEVIRFEGSTEINRYMLYSVAIAPTVSLSVALRIRIPLPIVRRIARETAAELGKLMIA